MRCNIYIYLYKTLDQNLYFSKEFDKNYALEIYIEFYLVCANTSVHHCIWFTTYNFEMYENIRYNVDKLFQYIMCCIIRTI